MIVLNTGSLTPTGERLQVASLKIDLSERTSQCAGTVIGGTPLQVGTWIKGQSGPGAGIVWRIKTVDDSRAGSGMWSFTAEHIVQALKDQILFGETKSQDMGGNKNTVSAASARLIALMTGAPSPMISAYSTRSWNMMEYALAITYGNTWKPTDRPSAQPRNVAERQ